MSAQSVKVMVGDVVYDTGTILINNGQLDADGACIVAVAVVDWAVDQGADRDDIRAMS